MPSSRPARRNRSLRTSRFATAKAQRTQRKRKEDLLRPRPSARDLSFSEPATAREYLMALQATHEDENGRPGAATVRERLSQPRATAC